MFILFLSACNSEENLRDLHRYITVLKKGILKSKNKDVIAEIIFPIAVTYQPIGKQRDPFVDEQATYSGKAMSDPLVAFPLNQYELMGTVTRKNQVTAVVKAPDNKIYQMIINDRIGNHYGRIVEIYHDSMKVEEVMTPEEGGSAGRNTTKRIVTLQLKGGS